MIRIACALVVLVACGASSEHATTPLHTTPVCPTIQRPTPLPPACAPAMCPRCPLVSAQPASPKPEARDWYCHRFVNNKRERTTLCWVSRAVCQRRRRAIFKKRSGKTTECAPQRVAYCTQVVQAASMARAYVCAQNMNDCERTRRRVLRGAIVAEHVTECRAMLNIDSYQRPVAFPPGSLPE